jgi:hypothetical protein
MGDSRAVLALDRVRATGGEDTLMGPALVLGQASIKVAGTPVQVHSEWEAVSAATRRAARRDTTPSVLRRPGPPW